LNHNFTLALIAHDRKKEELADFVFEHRTALSRFHLVATAGTGSLIRRRTGLTIHLLEHGPDGGDRQIGELAEDNEVQAVVFFRDPVSAAPHEPDFADLLRVCDTREIPLATNRATAEALVYFLATSPDRGAITARPWGFAPDAGVPPELRITNYVSQSVIRNS
jgi:methylglyoxal synthase